MGIKRSEYIKESNVQDYHNYIQGTGDLLGVDEDNDGGATNAIDDLLGMGTGPSTI